MIVHAMSDRQREAAIDVISILTELDRAEIEYKTNDELGVIIYFKLHMAWDGNEWVDLRRVNAMLATLPVEPIAKLAAPALLSQDNGIRYAAGVIVDWLHKMTVRP